MKKFWVIDTEIKKAPVNLSPGITRYESEPITRKAFTCWKEARSVWQATLPESGKSKFLARIQNGNCITLDCK